MAISWIPCANLRGINLQGANLYHANLRDTDLRYGDLRGTNLEKAKLDNAKLGWCNLFRARIVDLSMAEYDHTTINPNGY